MYKDFISVSGSIVLPKLASFKFLGIVGIMRELASWKVLAVFAAIALWGQAPSNVKIDSPQARVLVVTEQPHHPSALHEHPMNRVMIYLGSGQMIRTTPDGKVQKLEFKTGDVRWSPAEGPHTSEYIIDHPFQLVEI